MKEKRQLSLLALGAGLGILLLSVASPAIGRGLDLDQDSLSADTDSSPIQVCKFSRRALLAAPVLPEPEILLLVVVAFAAFHPIFVPRVIVVARTTAPRAPPVSA